MDDVRNAPAGWKLTRTVEDTKLLLMAGLVDHLSLDHDMGMCDSCREKILNHGGLLWCEHVPTGMALVDWMVETGHWPKFKPVVHSANPIGKMRMQMTIERYWHD